MEKLDPKVTWLFFWTGLLSTVLSTVGIWLIITLNIAADGYDFPTWTILIVGVIILIATPINFIWSKLVYNSFGFELNEDALKIEKGVISKKYISIPYDRIQNVDILRGPIARILGLSDLQIQTAGMSFNYKTKKAQVEGRLPGLSIQRAEELRNALVQKAKASDSGL